MHTASDIACLGFAHGMLKPRASLAERLLAGAALLWLGAGEVAAAPVVGVTPSALPHVTLKQDTTSTQTLTVRNDGDAPLIFALRIEGVAGPAAGGGEILVVEKQTPNATNPSEDPSLVPYAEYSGTHLHFGISSFGEIMPYQYPVGNEHLRLVNFLAGYTLAYRVGAAERLAFAAFSSRSSLVPISYEELENSASRVRVRVVTETGDGALRITRSFDFAKSSKHVAIDTEVQNVSGSAVDAVVLKEYADWDVDNSFGADTFDADDDANLLYAYQTHYCGIASDREPDFQDLYGWEDYTRRLTDQRYRRGPVLINGLALLHFELGALAAGASQGVATAYASGDTLDELRDEIGVVRWLRADVTSGVVAPGASQEVVLTYDATDLELGDHTAEILVASNDAVRPAVLVPAILTVTPDPTPPAAVDDLLASDPTPTSVRLSWSAVADNGAVGRPAASYDVRYSTAPFSEASWDAATPAEGEPPPGIPGSAQSFVVSGLVPATSYSFALKVADDGGLLSPRSNVATQTTPAPPNLVVDPGAISDTLTESQTATHTLTVSNTGGYPLSYRVSAAETSASAAVVSAATSRSTAPHVSAPVAVLDQAEYVDGEIVVRFVPGSGRGHRSAARASARARLKRNIPRLDMQLWELPSKGRTAMLDNLNVLRKNPNVLYAEPNYVVRALGRRGAAGTPQAGLGTIAAPSDPRFDDLWGLHNTGQTGGTEDADIDALEAWGVSTGAEGVVVAVIDTGVDYTHPDLADNTWVNADEIAANGIDDDSNGYVDDVHGYDFAYHDADPMDGHKHGTHCAGTIGAVGNNGIGVIGVNHDVTIMAVKFLDDGGFGKTAAAVEAVLYAVDNGAVILSNSWGGGGPSSALKDAIVYALDHDVLFVAAAGNDSVDTDIFPNYPSNYDVDNVMSIASTDHNDLKAGTSNWGLNTVDLGAPGVEVLSTVPGAYSYSSGTSMATPHVSGAAALLKAHNPSLSALEIKAVLMGSVDPIASLAGRTVSGGRLNAANALRLAGPDWVRLEGDGSGAIPPGFSTSLLVRLDATGKLAGDYEAQIRIESTDPDTPLAVVAVDLTVLPDCCPPSPVDDLAATGVTSSRVALAWRAVGDDGVLGRASEYDIRYGKAPLTEATWDAATPALGEPPPSDPGSLESFELVGLEPVTPYWIGIKVRDSSGNLSDLSNVVAITTLVPPRIALSPPALEPVTLEPGGATTRVLRIANEGGEALTFDLRIATAVAPEPGGEVIVVEEQTPNQTDPTGDPSLVPYAEYSGTHLHFGISGFGEIMPYQYPVGNGQLRFLAGYTLAYRVGAAERLAIAGFSSRNSLTPVSYEELENSASRVRVRVVTGTGDGALRITRSFAFAKSSKHLVIVTEVQNTSASPVGAVVLKEYANWDVDGSLGGDTFDADDDANLLYAYQTRYCGIATEREPDFQDLNGWNDYARRLTDEQRPGGPVPLDGLVLLHFELGALAAGASQGVATAYASGDTLYELRGEIGVVRWLRPDVASGVVAPGASQQVVLTYDATDPAVGEYAAQILVASNDPVRPEVAVPATLTVNRQPIAEGGGPYVADEGSAVLFDGSGSTDPDGDVLQYRWDHDADGAWDGAWSTSPTSSFTWSNDRVGTARLAVSDGHFEAEDTASVSVLNVPPTAYDRLASTDEDVAVAITLTATDPGADAIGFLTVVAPAHGTLSGAPPNLVYTPELDYQGPDSFQYVANDGAASSNVATVSITIAPVDGPPTCADDDATTDEDAAVTISVTSNDTAGPPDEDRALTIVEAVGAAHGTVVNDGGATLTYTPAQDYFGADAFSYTIRDNGGQTGSCSVSVAIAPVNDPPTVSVDRATQSVQYSDAIAPVTVRASDIDSPSLVPDVDPGEGLVLGREECSAAGVGVECSWELGGRALLEAGEHAVAISAGDGELQGHVGTSLVVLLEDATARFSPDNEVAVEVVAPGGESGVVSLVVDLVETVPDAATTQPHGGDVGLADASVTLEPIGPGSAYPGECSASEPTGEGYEAVKRITCSFDALEVNSYSVQVAIGGDYYTGAGEDALTVFDPSLGFVTGGGWFRWPGTEDMDSGYPGDRTTFGMVMKYNKRGAGLRGSFVLVSHLPDGASRRVKSNGLYGLSIGGQDEVADSFGWAAFSGNATYQEAGESNVSGSHGFTVYVEDRRSSGAGRDRIWVEVEDKDGTALPQLSMPAAAPDHAAVLAGGNVVVPHLSSDHDSDGTASIDDNCPGAPNPGQEDTDGDGFGNACDHDDDDDGLLDAFELAHGFDPLLPGEEGLDADGDGLDNLAEQASGTDPGASDSDGDGFSDAAEVAANSDPKGPASTPVIARVPSMPTWGRLLLALLIMLAAYRVAYRPS